MAIESSGHASVGHTDGNFKYNYSKPDGNDSVSLLSSLGLSLSDQGFLPIWTHTNTADASLLADVGADGIYMDTAVRSGVAVRLGLTPRNHAMNGKIVKWGDDYLYHGTTQGGLGFALLFRGVEQDKVIAAVQRISKSISSKEEARSNLDKVYDFLIPSAQAVGAGISEPCLPVGTRPGVSGLSSGLDAVSSGLLYNSYRASFGCMVGAVKGAWDSTGGAVIGVGKFALKVVSTNPIQTAEQAWRGTKKAWAAAQSLQRNLYADLDKAVNGFDALSPEAKGKMVCDLASMVGVGVIVSILTEGSAAPATALKINQEISVLTETPEVASALAKAKKLGSEVPSNIALAPPAAVNKATALVSKQVFGAKIPTSEEQAFVASAVSKGLAGPIDHPDATSIKQLHDAVQMLEQNETETAAVKRTASEIVSNLPAKDLSPGEIQIVSRSILAGADFGVTDPKRFAQVISEWKDGRNGLDLTLERAADLEHKPEFASISDPDKRKIAAMNEALDETRKLDPHFAPGISDKDWPAQRDHLRQCGIGI